MDRAPSPPGEEFRFQQPNRRGIWRDLALTMSQAATLTGVSERQIQHWMDKGYIQPTANGSRKIGGDGLDTILLIKQARVAGIPLRRAVPLARAYLAREGAGALDSDIALGALQDLQERLTVARAGIELVERALDDVVHAASQNASTLPRPAGDHV